MPVPKTVNAEPLPGYRLIAPLGSGGFGEVWKCEAPGGLFKAIKFVYGDIDSLEADSARAEEELRAFQHIKSIRHPFLLSIDRVENVNGELVIVTELADLNLHELLEQYQTAGKAGLPREKLIGYLREAAEVLDLMHQKFQLQHLDIKPANLFLVSDHVKVADFGLVSSLSAGSGSARVDIGAITPVYAAPELFHGDLSQHSDQYSLAIVFQELLIGTLPFHGKNCRQLLFQHTKEAPDLGALSAVDREAVSRALAKDPSDRFPSCLEFVQALVQRKQDKPSGAPVPRPDRAVETVSVQAESTKILQRTRRPSLPSEVLAGFQFGECLGSSPLMDQWRAQGPDGRPQLIKIIYGLPPAQQLEEAIARLKSIDHPLLTDAKIVHADGGRLVLLTDLASETLRDRAQECQTRNAPGIMRGELLDYMRTAAEALDYLFEQHLIEHLNLNPRNLLLLDDGRFQIAEFGLAQLLWLPSHQGVAQRNARYAPPELFDRHVSKTADQYSLAIIYCELLTGIHPLRGSGASCSEPSLRSLPESDREIIARALDRDPKKRWQTCMDLLRALEGISSEEEAELRERPDHFTSMVKATPNRNAPPVAGATEGDLNQIIADLIRSAGGQVTEVSSDPTALTEEGDTLRHRFQAGLPLGTARLKLESFAKQWYAQLIRDGKDGCAFHISMPSKFWQQWIGRQPGLEVDVRLARVNTRSATPIDVTVSISAFQCSKKHGQQLLQEMGRLLIESVRNHLLTNSEKRTQDRLLWPHSLKVYPLHTDGKRGHVIECRGKDISHNGIGFYLPEEISTAEVLIELPNRVHPPAISIPARLVRARRCADGWYDVGALFRLPALRKSLSEICLPQEAKR